MLTFSDKVLITLAFLGDAAIEVYTRGNGFGWKKDIFESMKIKNSTFRSIVFRNLKVGNIEKIISKSGRPYFKLTSCGREKIERFFPLLKLAKNHWDGKWRVVMFDIPEKEKKSREALRASLVSLGFGKIQESVYVSPLDVVGDVKEFLKSNNLLGKALIYEAKEVFSPDPKATANYVWKLDEINDKYKKLLDENEEGEIDPFELKERLFKLLRLDPFLPKEFLPTDWVGEKARKTIMSL